ncbi:GDSL-type esterase/lipase family protein [Acinetobacter baumannii]|nr:GDSL-type esterase/lipase family protein [Acinetobacter baumannii]
MALITEEMMEGLWQDIQDIKRTLRIKGIIEPRDGDPFNSLPLAIENVENKGGYITAPTLAALQAIMPLYNHQVGRDDSTGNEYRWNPAAVPTPQWEPTGRNYLKDAQVDATNKANTAETNAIQHTNSLIGQDLSNGIYAVVKDILNQSPLWIQNGYIGFTFLELLTLLRVKSQMGLGSAKFQRFIPLAEDINGKCPVWLEEGLFDCGGVHQKFVEKVKDKLGPISGGASNNVTKAEYPIISDGASLRQWKAKVSNLKYGIANTQPRLLLAGDSWVDYGQISNRILTTLRTYLGEAGTGWINLGDPKAQFDGVKVERAGTWAFEDLNINANFTYSAAPDGYALISSTAGSTLNLDNLNKGDQLTVFFGKTEGTFKYSINNGAEVEVTASSSGATIQTVMIPVGPLNNIVFTVTSGTIAFYGFHLRKSSGSGVEVTKIGNAGATGKDYLKISPAAQANLSDYLKPDAVIIFLGTNDYRNLGNTSETYKNGVSAMVDGFRTNNPNCGIILVAPARSDGDVVTPLSAYRDAVYELAQSKQCEFYNMYDDWDDYGPENTNGQWADKLHLSHQGSYRLSQKLFKNFFEV